MSAGYQVSQIDINNRAGAITVALRQAFADVINFKTWLDAQTDATLTSAPISMLQADVNVLRSAFSDMKLLNDIRIGVGTQATTKDFTAFAKQLTGLI